MIPTHNTQPQATCLVVIDVQNALFTEGDLHNKTQVLDNILLLLTTARNNNVPTIFIQHTEPSGLFQKNTKGWQLHEKLQPFAVSSYNKIVYKSSWDGFLNTPLENTLKEIGAKTLILAGMQTEFCLDTTLRRAYSLGYKCLVAQDGHSTFDTRILSGEQIIHHHNSIWHGRFAKLMPTSLLLDTISESSNPIR